jgi:transglutaminase-like putative cysteine protease
MRYRIERIDRIGFNAPVREHHFEYRIAPWDDAGQRVAGLEIVIDPGAEVGSHRDCFGNQVHRAALLGAHERLAVHMTAEVQTLLANPFDFEPVSPAREADWIADSLRQAPRLWDFVLHRSVLTPSLTSTALSELAAGDELAELGLPIWRPGVALLTQVQEAAAWVSAEFNHDPDLAPAASLDELLLRRSGAGADLAHLLVAIARSWRIPARFVTGYLDPAYFEPDDDAPETTDARRQTLHCWMEILIPGGGWRGFDAAQGLVADDTYIRLAVGRDLRDVVGFRQSFKGDGEPDGLHTEIDVYRLE